MPPFILKVAAFAAAADKKSIWCRSDDRRICRGRDAAGPCGASLGIAANPLLLFHARYVNAGVLLNAIDALIDKGEKTALQSGMEAGKNCGGPQAGRREPICSCAFYR